MAPVRKRKRLRIILLTLTVHLCVTSLLIALAIVLFRTAQPLQDAVAAGFALAVWTLPMILFVAYFMTASLEQLVRK